MRDLPGAPAPSEPGVPEVSVVVPAHDDGLYLDTCLASVHRQNFGAWECIVVDDASVDDTLAVALRWAGRDDRFRIVRHDRNLGLAATRNTAVARARGRYVTLLDARSASRPAAGPAEAAVLRSRRRDGWLPRKPRDPAARQQQGPRRALCRA